MSNPITELRIPQNPRTTECRTVVDHIQVNHHRFAVSLQIQARLGWRWDVKQLPEPERRIVAGDVNQFPQTSYVESLFAMSPRKSDRRCDVDPIPRI